MTPRDANKPGAGRRPGAEVHPRERVSEVQRARMLMAARQVVAEAGYARMSVERVVARAGVSRKTFYDLFENREDCFIEAFDDAIERMAAIVREAYESEQGWRGQMRAGLAALLGVLDDEPELRTVCVVEALAAGPRVLDHRTRVLRTLIAAVDEGRNEAKKESPPLAAEGVVGAVLAVIHARAVESGPAPEGRAASANAVSRRKPAPKPLSDLHGALIGMIVLPYLGPAAADRELTRRAPKRPKRPVPRTGDALEGLDMRLTYRTLRVLSVLAQRPGASNRLVAEQAGVSDQGQVSKLLMRLSNLGLIENSGDGHTKGAPNAWRLTPRGQDVENAIRIDTGAAAG
jgi:AcrR family transcriptional regulator/DNA-binding MarR family transcriptional regulator